MNVLIVDGDKSFCKSMKKLLSNVYEIQKIECIYANEKLPQYVKDEFSKFDVCLIDINTVGSEIENINILFPQSNIIVFSEKAKDISKYINKSKFDRFFLKPIDPFNVYSYLLNRFNVSSKNQSFNINKSAIIDELTKIGFSICHKGTTYLADACLKMAEEPNKKANEVYDEIGLQYNLTGNQICWAINNALNKAVENDRNDKMTEYFCFCDGRRASVKFIMKFFANRYGECIN